MKEIFGIIALALSVGANIPYVIEIVHGQAQPQRVSWLIWTILGGVYFFSTIIDTGATLFTAGELIGPVVIFMLSLKFGLGGKSKFDIASLALAIAALGLLFATDEVLPSLLLALFIDSIATFITIKKLRKDPDSESRMFWAIGAVSSIFAVLSLREYVLVALLFPIYVFLISTYIFLIAEKNSPGGKEVSQPF